MDDCWHQFVFCALIELRLSVYSLSVPTSQVKFCKWDVQVQQVTIKCLTAQWPEWPHEAPKLDVTAFLTKFQCAPLYRAAVSVKNKLLSWLSSLVCWWELCRGLTLNLLGHWRLFENAAAFWFRGISQCQRSNRARRHNFLVRFVIL